jgi:hypothetical protein
VPGRTLASRSTRGKDTLLTRKPKRTFELLLVLVAVVAEVVWKAE